MFRELCGEPALKNVVLVTNMWREDTRDISEARERELSGTFFKSVLDKGARMVRHLNTTQSAHDVIRSIMMNRPVVLQIQRELVNERKDIINTAAGMAINRELGEQMRQHEDEFKRLWEDMVQATKERDEETRKELDEERRRLQERMGNLKKDSEGMTANYVMQKRRTEARMIEMEQRAKKEGGSRR